MGAPAVGSYRFVLIREDVAPETEQEVHAYSEVCRSRNIEWRGRRVSAVFPREKASRDRFVIHGRPPGFGWRDITTAWTAENPPTETVVVRSATLDDDEVKILQSALADPNGRGKQGAKAAIVARLVAAGMLSDATGRLVITSAGRVALAQRET